MSREEKERDRREREAKLSSFPAYTDNVTHRSDRNGGAAKENKTDTRRAARACKEAQCTTEGRGEEEGR